MFHQLCGQSHTTVSINHFFLKRKESRSGWNRGPSAYPPSALPLGHTGSHWLWLGSAGERSSPWHDLHGWLDAKHRVTNFRSLAPNYTAGRRRRPTPKFRSSLLQSWNVSEYSCACFAYYHRVPPFIRTSWGDTVRLVGLYNPENNFSVCLSNQAHSTSFFPNSLPT